MLERIERLFWVLILGANCIALLFNGIGLWAIIRYQKKTNQNIILFILSFVEIIIAICGIMYRVEDKVYIPRVIMDVFRCAQKASSYQLILTMHLSNDVTIYLSNYLFLFALSNYFYLPIHLSM